MEDHEFVENRCISAAKTEDVPYVPWNSMSKYIPWNSSCMSWYVPWNSMSQYIPRNMNMICCVLCSSSLSNHVIHVPISFRVTSLALGQYNCPSASEITLKDMGRTNKYQNKTQQRMNHLHKSQDILSKSFLYLTIEMKHWHIDL